MINNLYFECFSDVLFQQDNEYDKVAGQKYLKTCLSIRSELKNNEEDREVNLPVPSKDVCVSIKEASWSELSTSIFNTLKQLQSESDHVCF